MINGYVVIDEDIVGDYSMVYSDSYGSDIPVQFIRKRIVDKLFIDDFEVGFIDIDYEDRVAWYEPGVRNVKVKSVVRIMD